VISRNSAFVYKGKPINAQSVADELGVQYVVEGSVRRAGSRVRITAQLIDAETDRHLWAERYDRELADIFAIQDEVTFRLGRSSIFPIKGIRVKRCAVKCSSLIISQRCSGRRPEAFCSVVASREAQRLYLQQPQCRQTNFIDRFLRASPHRYLPISRGEARHGRADAIEITTADALEI